jgi:hypothetical protein
MTADEISSRMVRLKNSEKGLNDKKVIILLIKQHFLRFIGRSDTAQFDTAILLPNVPVRCKVLTASDT